MALCTLAFAPAIALGQESESQGLKDQGAAQTPASAEPRGPVDVVSDSWISAKTKIALFADDRVSGWDVHVDTRNGVVDLQGNVDSDAARSAAEEVARGIEGVRDVRNELRVASRPEGARVAAKDDDLEDSVEAQLDRDARLRQADVEVDVEGGVVRLTGEVETTSDSALASEQARQVPGVRAVRNELRVKRDDRLGAADQSGASARGAASPAGQSARAATPQDSSQLRGGEQAAIVGMAVTPEQIRLAQERLKERGYNPGQLSGVVDEQTQTAIRDFQKAEGLRNTGRLDIATSRQLGLDAVAEAQPAR
jgi:hyperosmotically inducible protein